ncbi:MAG: glycosyltransferase family 87 protein [bacterium]
MHDLAHRVRARLGAVPVPRLRRIILAIYFLTALGDAAGKALAATPAFNSAVSRLLHGGHAEEMREAKKPSGNFEIFRASSRHLVAGQDLYAEYPTEHSDRFKYSPTFALLFSPLSWLPWPIALFLWSSLNFLVLFGAAERVLPARTALFAMACLHLEILRSMQNAQSNTLVAGLIVLAFAFIERRSAWRSAAAVAIGASIKIFPLAALTFAVPKRLALRTGLWAAGLGAVMVSLPLLVTSHTTLFAQYRWWSGVESSDALQRWFSAMELLHRWTGENAPNWWIQLAGVLVLVAPLALRRNRWDEPRFRFLYLCSVLLFTVLLNHQAERASYVIAFTGATLWYASSEKTRWRNVLYGLTFIAIPLMSTLIPGAILKTRTVMLYRLALPSLVIWVAVLWELFKARSSQTAAET